MFTEYPELSNQQLTPQERESLRLLHYPTKPLLFDAKTAVATSAISVMGDKIVFRPHLLETPINLETEIIIPPERQYSWVSSIMLGLNEALVRAEEGNPLRDAYEAELQNYNTEVQETGSLSPLSYGIWAYYPRPGNLVQYAPPELHRLALVSSNSRLHMDPEKKYSWEKVQHILRHTTPAIIGLSVGLNIGVGISMTLRPDAMLVSDLRLYKLPNANRVVGLGYPDMLQSQAERNETYDLLGLRNKAIVFAEQIHQIDPFINIFPYPDGVDATNSRQFLEGNRIQPRASVVIEVCDNPNDKLDIAEQARELGIRFIRFTDAGSTVRVDIRPFDLDPRLPLAIDVSDSELIRLKDAITSGGIPAFFSFAGSLVGPDHLERGDEFGMLVTGKIPRVVASIPQLGSTAMAAGGFAGELLARMALGHSFPERFVVDMQHLTTFLSERWVEGMDQDIS